MKHAPALALLLMILTASLGCQADRGTALDAESVDRLSRLPYPKDADYGPDLDIVVTKSRLQAIVSNRTPRTYHDVELWLNRQYVQEIDTIEIGGGNRFPLTSFINKHTEPFPTPGFLRPDTGAPVVLAELYDPATKLRNRLVVQTIDEGAIGVEDVE